MTKWGLKRPKLVSHTDEGFCSESRKENSSCKIGVRGRLLLKWFIKNQGKSMNFVDSVAMPAGQRLYECGPIKCGLFL